MRTLNLGYDTYRWWNVCTDEASFFKYDGRFASTTINKLIGGTAVTDIDGNGGFKGPFDFFYIMHTLQNIRDSITVLQFYGWENFDFTLNAVQAITRAIMFADKVSGT